MEFEIILFDVGNTLLHVPENPHKLALQSVSHLGHVPFQDYRATIDRVYREWRETGGLPERQDLPDTCIAHSKRALKMTGFNEDSAAAAELIEHTFLKRVWESFPEVIAHGRLLKAASCDISSGIESDGSGSGEYLVRWRQTQPACRGSGRSRNAFGAN